MYKFSEVHGILCSFSVTRATQADEFLNTGNELSAIIVPIACWDVPYCLVYWFQPQKVLFPGAVEQRSHLYTAAGVESKHSS